VYRFNQHNPLSLCGCRVGPKLPPAFRGQNFKRMLAFGFAFFLWQHTHGTGGGQIDGPERFTFPSHPIAIGIGCVFVTAVTWKPVRSVCCWVLCVVVCCVGRDDDDDDDDDDDR
jgi:hypothetical protein